MSKAYIRMFILSRFISYDLLISQIECVEQYESIEQQYNGVSTRFECNVTVHTDDIHIRMSMCTYLNKELSEKMMILFFLVLYVLILFFYLNSYENDVDEAYLSKSENYLIQLQALYFFNHTTTNLDEYQTWLSTIPNSWIQWTIGFLLFFPLKYWTALKNEYVYRMCHDSLRILYELRLTRVSKISWNKHEQLKQTFQSMIYIEFCVMLVNMSYNVWYPVWRCILSYSWTNGWQQQTIEMRFETF
jgi:hypothetical protein